MVINEKIVKFTLNYLTQFTLNYLAVLGINLWTQHDFFVTYKKIFVFHC